jgi:16S rRNA processing protein RimM
LFDSAPAAHGPWVRLAQIRRTQGRKGEVFAAILTDFPEKFAERRKLWLLPVQAQKPGAPGPAGEISKPSPMGAPGPSHLGTGDNTNPPSVAHEVELIHHWLHKGGIVLHFAGIDSISTAEALIGFFVAIPMAERAPLPEDEAYVSDLVGCTVVDVAGPAPAVVGVIEDVDRTAGPVPLLIVRGGDGEVLIPFAGAYLRKLDLAGKRIEMALPEGLIGLNTR